MTGLKIAVRNGQVSGNKATKSLALPANIKSYELSFKLRRTGETPAGAFLFFQMFGPEVGPYAGLPVLGFNFLSPSTFGGFSMFSATNWPIAINADTVYNLLVRFEDTTENGELDTLSIYKNGELVSSGSGFVDSRLPTSLQVGALSQQFANPANYDIHVDDILLTYETTQEQTSVKMSQDADLSEWDSTSESGGSTITSHADAGMDGTAGGLKVTIASGGTAYVRKDFDEFEGVQHELNLFVNKELLTMADADKFVIAQIRNASNSAIARLHLDRSTTNRRISFEMKDDSGSYVPTAAHNITAAQDHEITAIVKRAASAVSADGSIELWIDNSLVETVPDLDIYDADHWSQIRVGAVDLLDAGTSGDLWIDEIELIDIAEGAPLAVSFAGAEGYGAKTIIASPMEYTVTSLADTDTIGTLRYGIQTLTGDTKIIAPGLDGWIQLGSALRIERPGIHIDFSGAAGKGIGVRDHTFEIRDSAVVRFMRFAPGLSHPSPDDGDALNIRLPPTRTSDIDGVMLDHCQILFAIDGSLDITNGRATQSLGPEILKNITIQNCIIAYHLEDAGHSEGNHSRPILIDDGVTNVSFLHNLIAFGHTRNPFIKRGGVFELVGNVIHGVREGPRLGQKNDTDIITANVVGNLGRDGQTTLNTRPILINVDHIDPETQADHEIYLAGNGTIDEFGNITIPSDQRVGLTSGQWGSSGSPADAKFFVSTANPWSDPKPTLRTGQAILDYVLANAGVTLPGSDSLRDAIIAHLQAGTGYIIDNPSEVAGYPDLS